MEEQPTSLHMTVNGEQQPAKHTQDEETITGLRGGCGLWECLAYIDLEDQLLTVVRPFAALLAKSALNTVVVGVSKSGLPPGSESNGEGDTYCNLTQRRTLT